MKKRLMMMLRRGMTCGEVLEVLQGYLDDEIDEKTARQVAAHLESCTECERESEVYRNIKSSLARRRAPVDPQVLAALQSFGEQLMAEPQDQGG